MNSTKKSNQEKPPIPKPPKEVREIGDGLEKIGKSTVKVGKEVGKGVYKAAETGVDTGIAVTKGVYEVGKAGIKTGVAVTKSVASLVTYPYKKRRSIRDYFWKARRGVITGAADNDPAGIATYSQVGASTGFSLLWLAFLTTPMLIAVEEMSARVGVIVRKGLGTVIKEKFGTGWAIFAAIILAICNIATLGADLAGMSAVLGILTGINWQWFLLPFALFVLYFLVKGKYSVISRFLFIITPIFLLYVITAIIIQPSWGQILNETFIPSFVHNISYWMAAVAVLGTTISAYLLFWETSQEIEEHKTVKDLQHESAGVTTGMIYSNLIFYFIVICTGAVLHQQGITTIETADQAALALKPLVGNLAFLLFSLGILVSGILAVPVLAASTSYVISNTFGWVSGLSHKPHRAKGFYLVIALALLAGSTMGLLGLKPMLMLFYSQILQGILTPILLIFLVLICNDKKLMGQYTNKIWSNFWGWFTITAMISLSIIMIWQWIIR